MRCAAALVSALFDGGVRHFVVSSGSRCTPLVVAAAHHPNLQIWTNPDERSAGFFALGVAKASRQPAALICTSGTAAANYFPAVVEARMSGTPLVVITADRPPRLRGIGAPQTIDQVRLYGNYSVHFEDLHVPDHHESRASEWILSAHRAVEKAITARGPAHLNTPFDEPLIPPPDDVASIVAQGHAVSDSMKARSSGALEPNENKQDLRAVADILARAKRPVIVCGPQDENDQLEVSVTVLAERIGAPVLADIASQVRHSSAAVAHADLILRDSRVAAHLTPDMILRIGGLPTSKTINEWIAISPAAVKVGISRGRVADPHGCLTHKIEMNPDAALDILLRQTVTSPVGQSEYRSLWLNVDQDVSRLLLDLSIQPNDVLESRIVAQVCERAGRDAILFLSNSMPIRWADMYADARPDFPRVLVNRGANGIDGIISTAAGAAMATRQTTICVLGDLTFLHDQNGLWRLSANDVPLKIVLLNNDGGGVFHFLPIASHTAQFEPLVAMPHGVDLSCLALAHGIPHHRVDSEDRFSTLLTECLGRSGPEVIEIRTDRSRNATSHHEIVRHVAETLRTSLGIG